jgi:hypothetical protein
MPTSTFTPIATYTLPSATTSYTFTSIPSTYTDLYLTVTAKGTGAGDYVKLRLGNGSVDTSTNYSYTDFYVAGTTGSMGYGWEANKDFIYVHGFGGQMNSSNTAPFGGEAHIFDYANTSTQKRIITRGFGSREGSSQEPASAMMVHSWRSTAAINTIQVYVGNYNMAAGSIFTLYGIKAGS